MDTTETLAATGAVRSDEFNCLGPFSDARPDQCQELRFMLTADPALEGPFKTPGLRGVADLPRYRHTGQFSTLEQVVRHHVAAPHAAVGHSALTHWHAGAAARQPIEPAPLALSDAEVADLPRFLDTLCVARRPMVVKPSTAATGLGRGRVK